MRALRSRTVQNDDDRESNEHEGEDLGNPYEQNISKKVKRKKLKKCKHDKNNSELDKVRTDGESGSNEHEGEDLGNPYEQNIPKKVKRKKLKKCKYDENNSELDKVRTDGESGSNEHEKEDVDHSAEKNVCKKVKRKKLKRKYNENNSELDKIRSDDDTRSNEQERKSERHSEKNISKKLKRKYDENNSELDNVQNYGDSGSYDNEKEDFDQYIEKKDSKNLKKIKKSKHESIRVRNDGESLSDELDDLGHFTEKKIKKVKQKKLTKLTNNENSLESDKIGNTVDNAVNNHETEEMDHSTEKNTSKKAKLKKMKEHTSYEMSQEFDKVQEKKYMKKRKSNKSTNDNLIDSTDSDTKILDVSTKSLSVCDKNPQKSREIMHATILKSPDFTNVITSTVLKPKRPEIQFEHDINSENNVNQKSTEKRNSQRNKSLSDEKKTLKLSKNKSLDVIEDAITIEDKNNDDSLKKKSLSNRKKSFNTSSKNNSLSTSITTEFKNYDLTNNHSLLHSSNEIQPKKILLDQKGTSKTKHLSVTENSIITIEDSPQKSTFNKTNTLQLPEETVSNNLENELCTTKILESSLNQSKTKLNVSTKNDTFNRRDTFNKIPKISSKSLSNNSLQDSWQVSENQTEINNDETSKLNVTFEIENKENDTQTTEKKILNTPKDLYKVQKQPVASTNLSTHKKSVKKTSNILKKSPLKSTQKPVISKSAKKSVTKRTAMPNFALIHKKIYDKMENLKEYSERKTQRAQMMSSNKSGPIQTTIKSKESKMADTKLKSSRQLFSDDKNGVSYNRFGFKMEVNKPITTLSAKPISQITIAKPVVKPSVFARADIVAIGNKNKVVKNNRENKRDVFKGVRTNRRFELLMQMRNK